MRCCEGGRRGRSGSEARGESRAGGALARARGAVRLVRVRGALETLRGRGLGLGVRAALAALAARALVRGHLDLERGLVVR